MPVEKYILAMQYYHTKAFCSAVIYCKKIKIEHRILTLVQTTFTVSVKLVCPFYVHVYQYTHFNYNYAPTLLLTRTTCDGISLINCFGADCWSNPTIVLVNGESHTSCTELQSHNIIGQWVQKLDSWLCQKLSICFIIPFHVVERPLSKKCIIKGLTVKVKGPWKTKHRFVP